MSIRKSLAFSFLDRYSGLSIAVISSMIIARLLTPTEIGVFSVVMVLLTLVSTVRDMGTGQYLVQEKELTTARIRSVWAVQLGLGFGLAALVLLASYPVAAFYSEPRMLPIMLVVALNYAINPFGSLTYAWLMREMQFQKIALMRFMSALGGALVAVALAWNGHGPISLAYGSLTSTVVNALVAIAYRPANFPWLPGIREIRRVLSFGSKLTVSALVTALSASAAELFIAKLQDLTSAGYYSRSNGLVQMFSRLFVDAVGSVCLPWFSQKSRDKADVGEPFVKATAYVTAFGWSFCLVVVFQAHSIIRVLYGDQWDAAIDLTRLLAVAMLFSTSSSLCQTALLSVGAVGVIARLAIVNATLTVLLIGFGSMFGLIGVGIAVVIAQSIAAILLLRETLRQLHVSFKSLLRAFRLSAVTACMTAIGPAMLYVYFGVQFGNSAMLLIFCVATAAPAFFAAIILLRHPFREELAPLLEKVMSRLKGRA